MNTTIQNRMRFQPTGLHVREAVEGEADSRIVEGCAIVFNQETTLWDDALGREREIIDPSACTAEFLATQDVKLNLLHNREQTVARNNKGEGTLVLDLREDGLYFSAEMPKCDIGDRALALVKNGTYTGCSFEFIPGDYDIEKGATEDDREDYLIRHTRFEAVTALTIALDPAYQQTSVNAREIYEERHPELKAEADEAARREAEAKKREAEQTAQRKRVAEFYKTLL